MTTFSVEDRTFMNGSNNHPNDYDASSQEQSDDVPTLPLIEMATCSREVLAWLTQGPVALTQDEQPVAVLLAVAEWNKLVDRLELLEDAVEIYKGRLAVATGKAKIHRLSPEELAEWANEPEPVLG